MPTGPTDKTAGPPAESAAAMKAAPPPQLRRWKVSRNGKLSQVIAETSEAAAKVWYAGYYGVPIETVSCEPA